jgi:acetoin utilization deacetylase AcuC-like enzyme
MTNALEVWYSADYACGGAAHFARLPATAERLAKDARFRIRKAEPIDTAWLSRLHAPAYVNAFLSGVGSAANSSYLPWSESLRRGVLAMLGGQLAAATHALDGGAAANLAIGFHHAHPDRGGGFCVFNGLALVALAHPTRNIAVLDCDEHGSDGTEAFCARLPNLWNFSLFGTRFGLRGGPRSRAFQVPRGADAASAFRTALDQALDELSALKPDLLLYQAGVDSHSADPRGTLNLSDADFAHRDRAVFALCRAAQLPVLLSFAGGYQSAETSAALYLATLAAAADSCR